MAGVKGRSGRRPSSQEDLRLRVIQKAWIVLEQALDDPNVPQKEKIDIATKICPKTIPTELTGDVNANIVAMGNITKTTAHGSPLEVLQFNIGSPLQDESESTEDPGHTGQDTSPN